MTQPYKIISGDSFGPITVDPSDITPGSSNGQVIVTESGSSQWQSLSSFANNFSNSGIAATSQSFFISNGGSDITGDGSFFNPWATIAKVNAEILSIFNSYDFFTVFFAPGIWSEVWQALPFVSYTGVDPGNPPNLNGLLTYDIATWTVYAPDDPFLALSNLILNAGYNFDDTSFGGANNSMFMQNCSIIAASSFISVGIEAGNWSELHHAYGNQYISTLTITNARMESTSSQFRNVVTLNATSGHNATVFSRGGNNIELGCVVNGLSTGTAIWNNLGTVDGIGWEPIFGQGLVLNGSNASFINAGIGSIPALVTTSSGAAYPTYQGLLPAQNVQPGANSQVLTVQSGIAIWAAGGVGSTGSIGPQGSPGVTGSIGPQGSPGITGATGTIGPQGNQGPTGTIGATGPQGIQGATGPTGTIGATGAVGINAYSTFTQGFSQPVSNRPPFASIQVPSGYWIQPGQIVYIQSGGYYQVASGSVPTFSLNNLGYTGNIPIGSTVSAGSISPGGLQGPAGSIGATGPAGSIGPTGTIGQTGIQGVQGSPGVTGPQGNTGTIGATGVIGPQGSPGVTGIQGANGTGTWYFNNGATLAFAQNVDLLGSLLGTTGPNANTVSINSLNDFAILGLTGSNAAVAGFASGPMVQWNNEITTPTGALGATSVGTAAGYITVNKSGWYDVDYSMAFTGVASGINDLQLQCFLNATGALGAGNLIPQSYAIAPISSGVGYINNSFLVNIPSGNNISLWVKKFPGAGPTGIAYSPTGSYLTIKTR